MKQSFILLFKHCRGKTKGRDPVWRSQTNLMMRAAFTGGGGPAQAAAPARVVDRPNQLFYNWIFIC